jgi:hypothetical protein
MDLSTFRRSRQNTDFTIDQDRFEDLEISAAPQESFYWFYHRKQKRLIKQFVLMQRPQVTYVCRVVLIKSGEKFTPRLDFSIRDTQGRIVEATDGNPDHEDKVRSRVSLDDCHEAFWSLISFLQSLKEVEIPSQKFSLVSQSESDIVAALRKRGSTSLVNIIKQLSTTSGVTLTEGDLNDLLRKRDKLKVFESALTTKGDDEKWWQNFFEQNKWIFGYGLNYQILRQEQAQPNFGGTRVEGAGARKGDFLTYTAGDISFTVLVEIKTPNAPLLHGKAEIRSGAWSLSKQLTDALSQIEADIATWDKEGSEQRDNKDRLEGKSIYTVEPKGIIVIGSLKELQSGRSKWETFQRFRQSVHGIDILTFDELRNRAQFIVEHRA